MSPQMQRNPARSLGWRALARWVHDAGVRSALIGCASAMVACILPPSLSVDNQDAGVNSPPAILAVRSDQQQLPENGTVNFEVATAAQLSVQLIDTDVLDKLYVRVFFDYSLDPPNFTAPRASCEAAPGEAVRTATCPLRALCTDGDVGQTAHAMSVMVFDREPLGDGNPPFQEMPAGGLQTSKFFFLKCRERPQ